jgi:YHS domain-containing protein
MRSIRYLVSVLTVVFALWSATAARGDDQKKLIPYPLKTCVVSGEKLGEMGKPYVFEYKGREMKFCCKGCRKDFDKEPAKYIKILEEAEAKAKK